MLLLISERTTQGFAFSPWCFCSPFVCRPPHLFLPSEVNFVWNRLWIGRFFKNCRVTAPLCTGRQKGTFFRPFLSTQLQPWHHFLTGRYRWLNFLLFHIWLIDWLGLMVTVLSWGLGYALKCYLYTRVEKIKNEREALPQYNATSGSSVVVSVQSHFQKCCNWELAGGKAPLVRPRSVWEVLKSIYLVPSLSPFPVLKVPQNVCRYTGETRQKFRLVPRIGSRFALCSALPTCRKSAPALKFRRWGPEGKMKKKWTIQQSMGRGTAVAQ